MKLVINGFHENSSNRLAPMITSYQICHLINYLPCLRRRLKCVKIMIVNNLFSNMNYVGLDVASGALQFFKVMRPTSMEALQEGPRLVLLFSNQVQLKFNFSDIYIKNR